MTQKEIWEKRWKKKLQNPVKSTSLDPYGIKSFEVLDKYIEQSDKKILEIGSGTGRFCIAIAKKYRNKEIMGIDYEDNAIKLSKIGAKIRNIDNLKFKKADMFKLPFKDNTFDIVFENGVVEHFKNYKDAIKEMKRVAKKGGKVIINVNNWYCYPKTIEKKILGKFYPFGYEKSFRHREIIRDFNDLGLSDIEVYAFNPFNVVYRYFFFSKPLRNVVFRLSEMILRSSKTLRDGRFSKKHGFMIFGKGIKI